MIAHLGVSTTFLNIQIRLTAVIEVDNGANIEVLPLGTLEASRAHDIMQT